MRLSEKAFESTWAYVGTTVESWSWETFTNQKYVGRFKSSRDYLQQSIREEMWNEENWKKLQANTQLTVVLLNSLMRLLCKESLSERGYRRGAVIECCETLIMLERKQLNLDLFPAATQDLKEREAVLQMWRSLSSPWGIFLISMFWISVKEVY